MEVKENDSSAGQWPKTYSLQQRVEGSHTDFEVRNSTVSLLKGLMMVCYSKCWTLVF